MDDNAFAEHSDRHPLADLDRMVHSPARLMLMSYLYVVESCDYIFLKRITDLTWGNLSAHLTKLEEAGYVAIQKEIVDKTTHSVAHLTLEGRAAFRVYREQMLDVLGDMPDE